MQKVIGRLHHLVLNTADPHRSAEFWSAVLGQPIIDENDHTVVVAANHQTSGVAFTRASSKTSRAVFGLHDQPQMYVEVMVDDVATTAHQAVSLGATRIDDDIFADPLGQWFCLIQLPECSKPVHTTWASRPRADGVSGKFDRHRATIALHCCTGNDHREAG